MGRSAKTADGRYIRGFERSNIVFSFVISLSVGIAVGLLLAWHVYLVLSAQVSAWVVCVHWSECWSWRGRAAAAF